MSDAELLDSARLLETCARLTRTAGNRLVPRYILFGNHIFSLRR